MSVKIGLKLDLAEGEGVTISLDASAGSGVAFGLGVEVGVSECWGFGDEYNLSAVDASSKPKTRALVAIPTEKVRMVRLKSQG